MAMNKKSMNKGKTFIDGRDLPSYYDHSSPDFNPDKITMDAVKSAMDKVEAPSREEIERAETARNKMYAGIEWEFPQETGEIALSDIKPVVTEYDNLILRVTRLEPRLTGQRRGLLLKVIKEINAANSEYIRNIQRIENEVSEFPEVETNEEDESFGIAEPA